METLPVRWEKHFDEEDRRRNPPPNDPFDRSDPRCILHFLTDSLSSAVRQVPPELFSTPPDILKKLAWPPVMVDERLIKGPPPWARQVHIAFWNEYGRCVSNEEKTMDMSLVWDSSACNKSLFLRQIVTLPPRVAWLLRPSPAYDLLISEIHQLSLERMRAIMDEDSTGNPKLMHVQAQIFEHFDMRAKGAIIQRIDQRTLNVNTTVAPPITGGKSAPKTMAELEREIAALEAKSKSLSQPGVIEVDITKSSGASRRPDPTPIEIEVTNVEEPKNSSQRTRPGSQGI